MISKVRNSISIGIKTEAKNIMKKCNGMEVK